MGHLLPVWIKNRSIRAWEARGFGGSQATQRLSTFRLPAFQGCHPDVLSAHLIIRRDTVAQVACPPDRALHAWSVLREGRGVVLDDTYNDTEQPKGAAEDFDDKHLDEDLGLLGVS